MAAVSPTVAPARSASAGAPEIVVLDGDQTGQELLEQALRVLDPSVVRLPLRFKHFDLSLESRRRTANQVITDAATPDLGGQSSTTDFTDEVIRRVTAKLEVWTT